MIVHVSRRLERILLHISRYSSGSHIEQTRFNLNEYYDG